MSFKNLDALLKYQLKLKGLFMTRLGYIVAYGLFSFAYIKTFYKKTKNKMKSLGSVSRSSSVFCFFFYGLIKQRGLFPQTAVMGWGW